MTYHPYRAAMQPRRQIYVVRTETGGEAMAEGPIDVERYVLGPFASVADAEDVLRARKMIHTATEWLTVVGLASVLMWWVFL